MTAIMTIRPDYEPAVKCWFPYGAKIVDMAKKLGYEVYDKAGALATQNEVFKDAPKVAAIFHNGHGATDKVAGQNELLWIKCQYPTSTVENKIGLFLSCLMGKELGPDMIQKKMKALIAWDEVYVFNWSGQDPIVDPFVKLFFDPLVDAAGIILEKRPINGAYNWIVSKYAENANKAPSPDVRANLFWDANHCVLLGDPNAHIEEEQPPSPPPVPPAPPSPKPAPKFRVTGYIKVFDVKIPFEIEVSVEEVIEWLKRR
jgi:hypothetical protein